MVEDDPKQLDRIYHALANQTRRRILRRLCREDVIINELAEPFNMSLAAVSKHIKVLEKAGLVKKTREANRFRCEICYHPTKPAAEFLHLLEENRDIDAHIQHEPNLLGSKMVAAGLINTHQRDAVLTQQGALKAEGRQQRFGQIAVSMGFCSQEQLEALLQHLHIRLNEASW